MGNFGNDMFSLKMNLLIVVHCHISKKQTLEPSSSSPGVDKQMRSRPSCRKFNSEGFLFEAFF